jgi:hypothetical protein
MRTAEPPHDREHTRDKEEAEQKKAAGQSTEAHEPRLRATWLKIARTHDDIGALRVDRLRSQVVRGSNADIELGYLQNRAMKKKAAGPSGLVLLRPGPCVDAPTERKALYFRGVCHHAHPV